MKTPIKVLFDRKNNAELCCRACSGPVGVDVDVRTANRPDGRVSDVLEALLIGWQESNGDPNVILCGKCRE